MVRGKLFDDEFLQRLARLGLIAKRISASSHGGGQRRTRRLGDGLEFADHRAYTPGDDMRLLDWPCYARMERMLLRLFHEHSEGIVTIFLDCSGSMSLGAEGGRVGKFDYARRTAAALAYVAMSGLDRVQIIPFSDELGDGMQTGRNRRQILQVLEYLETLNAEGRTSLGASVEQYARRYKEAGTVIILTDLLDADDDLAGALSALRQRTSEVILLQIVDRYDAAPSLLGPMQLGSVETGRRMNLNINETVLASYAERWGEFIRSAEKSCLEKGAIYLQAPTSSPFERLVLQVLEKAGVLQI
ncbi:MAG: DUF58 domain-containing protein [Planctomycetota bacterium]|nr:DUF58 domain-containing protein [Planctomycetota bacterium]